MKKIKKLSLIILMLSALALPSIAIDGSKATQKAYKHYQKQEYDKALKYFLSLKEEEINDEIMVLISNSYDSCGEKILAYNTLQELIRKSPKNYKGYYNLGVLNYKNGNIDFAIDCFEKALKFNKKSSESSYNLACCYLEKEEFKKAAKYFKKALKYNSNNPSIYYNLAYTYKKIGKDKKYQKYLNKYNGLVNQH